MRKALEKAFGWVRDLFKAAWLFFPALFVVCLIYYILLTVDLAYDTLMIAGEHWSKLFLTVLAVSFWSWVVWFSSRIVSLIPRGHLFPKKNFFIRHLPRFLAINCFIALQTAILVLPRVKNMHGIYIFFFISFHLMLFALLSWAYKKDRDIKSKLDPQSIPRWWQFWKHKSWQWWLAQNIAAVYIVLLCVLAYFNHKNLAFVHSWMLPILAILLYLMQVLCTSLFSNRRMFIENPEIFNGPISRVIQSLDTTKATDLHRRLLQRLGLSPQDVTNEAVYYMLFHFLCLFVAVCYLFTIRSIWFSVLIGPLTFAVLGLGVLILFFNLIGALSRHWDFNLSLIVWVLAFGIGRLHHTHQVRMVPATYRTSQRMCVDTFVTRWLNDPIRCDSIEKADSFMAYIVLSDGGGARSATWTAMLLSQLEDSSKGGFSRHLFSMAGASGGTVGNTAFYGLLKAEKQKRITAFYPHADTFFKGDFLTYTLGRLLGPDFFGYMVPMDSFQWMDRAAAMETAFEYGYNDPVIAGFFAESIDTGYDYSGRLPAFFMNTTDVRAGMNHIVSNVRLKDSLRINVLDPMDSMTLRVSTAAILSSRFPWVSPAGELNKRYYVDGGYVDNSGAETTEAFMREVYAFMQRLPEAKRRKIRFQVIEIHNGQIVQKPEGRMNPLVNDLLAPVLTLIGMQDGSTKSGNYQLASYMDSSKAPIQFELYRDTTEETYPMSWINSEYQLNRIRERLALVKKSEYFGNIVNHSK